MQDIRISIPSGIINGCHFAAIEKDGGRINTGQTFEFSTSRGGHLLNPAICENLFIADIPRPGAHYAIVVPRWGRLGRWLRQLGGVTMELTDGQPLPASEPCP